MPVHDRHQIHKPTGHGNVRDIGRPHLIGMIDGQVPEQIGVNPVLRMGTAGVRLGVDRLDAHQSHQPLDAFAVDRAALSAKMPRHRAAAVDRCFQVLLVDQAHEFQILGANRARRIVERGPAQPQQLALAGDARLAWFRLYHRFSLLAAQEPSFRAKKSFSTLSWPICR